MRYLLFLLAILPLIWTTNSCKTANEVELYPCDTTDISYQNDILPIIETKCYKCHSDANAPLFAKNAGGFPVELEGYAKLSPWATSSPGGSSTSYLLGNIKHDLSDPEFSPMPKGDPKLPQCEIDKIEAWINKGVPNN